jgi:hypothetical protein
VHLAAGASQRRQAELSLGAVTRRPATTRAVDRSRSLALMRATVTWAISYFTRKCVLKGE